MWSISCSHFLLSLNFTTHSCIDLKDQTKTMKTKLQCSYLFSLFSAVLGVHDSLNMILPAGKKECFYEEFVKNGNPREVEIFVPQNGKVDIILYVYGPLTLADVQQVGCPGFVILFFISD